MTQRQPRLYDRPYLDWLKTRYCVACSKAPPSDPAHIRETSLDDEKPITGMGRKPDDKWAVPLCRTCHAAQHAAGNETEWWKERGLNPFNLARDYYEQFGGGGGKPKPRKAVKARLPREKRAKMKTARKNAWPKRKLAR